MTCARCGGLMVRESALDLSTSFLDANHWIDLWACVACGNREDHTILLHRRAQRAALCQDLALMAHAERIAVTVPQERDHVAT